MWPVIGVIGCAGPIENNTCSITNIPHWPIIDANSVSQTFGIEKLLLINDFGAAGLYNIDFKIIQRNNKSQRKRLH